jgi:aspartate-semialdehyde dehydrogenase
MMDELIQTIKEITVKMNAVSQAGDYQEFEKLLADRNDVMLKVEEEKNRITDFEYSAKAKEILKETMALNKNLIPFIEKEYNKTETMINQVKMNKTVSRKYQPYMKQTNGAFVDTNK